MKKTFFVFAAIMATLSACNEKTPGEYVDPNIGGIAPLLTTVTPQVHRPHSMVRVFPLAGQGDRYLSDYIYGIALNMPRYRMGAVSSIMATSGPYDAGTLRSWYDHGIEELHPWGHHVYLQDFDIDAAWTTTERTVLYDFKFNSPGEGANVVISTGDNPDLKIVVEDGSTVVSGYEAIHHGKQYFYAVLDHAFPAVAKDGGRAVLSDPSAPSEVLVRVGISFISTDQAKVNLEAESAGKTFAAVEKESRDIWEDTLGRITVKGGTERQRRIFYTSLYRMNERMVNYTESGRYYSGMDNAVHEADRAFYCDDWAWDTYRTVHPLDALMNPGREADQLQSYSLMYDMWGWVPQFPALVPWDGFLGDKNTFHGEPMVGTHVASIAADAISKGIVDFDVENLYEGLVKTELEGTMIPWGIGPAQPLDKFYAEHGYFPAIGPDEPETQKYVEPGWEKRQAVSVTLEHSYDDWCIARIAKYLGRDEDYDFFMARSKNYLNLWNPEIGFFAPRREDGSWVEPFDTEVCGGSGARNYFTEVSAWVHVFQLQHDIPALIDLMGGPDKFVERLDLSYNKGPAKPKFMYMNDYPDGTGLHGMIPAGNEPAFHIPWLYNYAGAPWKTQFRTHQVADMWYDDTPTGLSGDDDGGALCGFYVFAAMGFYPVNPASGEYAISSPFFEEVSIDLPEGKKFTIKARGASERCKYITSAVLDGRRLDRPFISYEDIRNGATLVLSLSDKPCFDAFN